MDKELLTKVKELHPTASLLIVANQRQGKLQGPTLREISDRVDASSLQGLWYVQGWSSCVPRDKGILSGLEWLIRSADDWDSD